MFQTIHNARNHAENVRAVAASNEVARSLMAASWRRSLLHHKLDPAENRGSVRLTEGELHHRREASGLLLRIATPVLDRLAGAAVEAGCAVFLTDGAGVIIDDRMGEADRNTLFAADLAPGAVWSEAEEGTNAIGTCLAEKRPVIVYRNQHFRARNSQLSCTGAPIFGVEGEVEAVIDVSSARGDITEAHSRLVAIAVSEAARRIERELFRAHFSGARILSAEGSDTSGPILLAVDRDDLILGATRAARRSFGLTPEDIAARRPAGDVLGETASGDLHDAARSEMLRALHRAGGNVSAAARDLKIGRATFYRKMKQLGLSED